MDDDEMTVATNEDSRWRAGAIRQAHQNAPQHQIAASQAAAAARKEEAKRKAEAMTECDLSPPPPREEPLTEWFRQYWVRAAFMDEGRAKQEAAYNRDPKRVAFGPEAWLRLRRQERWLAVQGGWAACPADRRFDDASDLIFYRLRLFVARRRECWQAAA